MKGISFNIFAFQNFLKIFNFVPTNISVNNTSLYFPYTVKIYTVLMKYLKARWGCAEEPEEEREEDQGAHLCN